MIIGSFYVFPSNSAYKNTEAIFEAENEIIQHFNNEKCILLYGNFNAKTRTVSDIPDTLDVVGDETIINGEL